MKTAVFLYHVKACETVSGILGNTEKADVFRSAIVSDPRKKGGKHGYRDIGERRTGHDDQTERRRIPENLEQIADTVDAAEKFVVLIEISDNVDNVQNEAGDRGDQSHIKTCAGIQHHSSAVSGDLILCAERPELGTDEVIIEGKNESGDDQNDGVDGGFLSFRIKHEERGSAHNAENGERDVRDEELDDLSVISFPEFFEVHNKRVPFIKVITTIIIASFFRLFKRFFKKYRKYEKN